MVYEGIDPTPEEKTGMKVTIDREECISCASCWCDCPQFFEENMDDGFSQILKQYRQDGSLGEGAAPASLEQCVQVAAEDCPVSIIHTEG